MWKAKQAEQWNHTADLMALIANVQPGSGGGFTRESFHPQMNKPIPRTRDVNEVL